jgi:DNA-binding NarL/FixJ family response regulator
MIRVFVVDDHPVVIAGLRQLLTGDIQVVGSATTISEARLALEKQPADVVVLDVRFPEGTGFDLLTYLQQKFPKLPVIVYSGYDNPKYVSRAINGAAVAYVLKTTPPATLIDCIRKAAQGENCWSREDIRRTSVALSAPRLNADVEAALTLRETDILRELVRGRTNKEIATNLKISYETVKEQVQHVLGKIGVSDRTQAAVWAVRNQIE